MRINGQSSMRIGQMILTGSNRTGVFKHNNALTKKCRDEYIQGVIQPSFTYSKNSAGSSISRSVIDTINFGYMGIHKNHGESVNSIKVNGTEYLKKDIPAVNPKWCTQIKAKNNVIHFDNGQYYKYIDTEGNTHTFSCDHDRLTQPYSDLISGRQNSKSFGITKFWNMLSKDGTYLGLYYSATEQKQFLNDAGIKEGFFSVESGSRKQDYFYSNGNAGVAVRKFEYDAVYDMFTKRGSALFNEYEVGTVIKVGGKEYAMNEDRKFDIPYGEDIFDIEFPKRSAEE